MKKTTKKTAASTKKKVASVASSKASKKAAKTTKTAKKAAPKTAVKKMPKKAVKKTIAKPVAKPITKTVKKAVKKLVKKIVKSTPASKKQAVVKSKPIQDNILNAAEINAYKEKLLILRARLRGDVSMMTDAALNKNRMESSGDLSAMPIHMADVGTDNFEQEQTLAFMQSESGILNMVEEALQRIKDGTYGICESCDCRIPKPRLSFLPYAAMCVKCAEIVQSMDD